MRWLCMIILVSISSIPVYAGPTEFEGFELDKVLHVEDGTSDLHYHLYVPDRYDGKEPYSLYISLPGYGGYYFQGMGRNLQTEHFAEEAKSYNTKMIIAAPQPNDWGQNSKRQIIALTEHIFSHYTIDRTKVYISGYSGGGETLSLVVAERPDLFTAALHVSSQWNGDLEKLAAAEMPLYFIIGEDDEYYTSRPVREAYRSLVRMYQDSGYSKQQIDSLVVLDIKDSQYFRQRNVDSQHGGGTLIAFDTTVMEWLFGPH